MNNYEQFNNSKDKFLNNKIAGGNFSHSPNLTSNKKFRNSSNGNQVGRKIINSYKFKENSESPFKRNEDLSNNINEEIKKYKDKNSKPKIKSGQNNALTNADAKLSTISNKNLFLISNETDRGKERERDNNRYAYLKNEKEKNELLSSGKGRNMARYLNNNNSKLFSQSKRIDDTIRTNNQETRLQTNGNKNMRQVLIDKTSFSPVIGNKNNIPTSISNNIPLSLKNKKKIQIKSPSFSIQLPNLYNEKLIQKSEDDKSDHIKSLKTLSLTPNKNESNSNKSNKVSRIDTKEGKKTITPDFERQMVKRKYSPIPENNFTGNNNNNNRILNNINIQSTDERAYISTYNNATNKIQLRLVKPRKSIDQPSNLQLVKNKNSHKAIEGDLKENSPSKILSNIENSNQNTSSAYNILYKRKKENNFPGSSSNSSSTQVEDKTKNRKNYIKNYFYRSQAGRNENGLTKMNQDAYVAGFNILGLDDYYIFGVLDGHGINGHHVSSAVNNFFMEYFKKVKNYSRKNLNSDQPRSTTSSPRTSKLKNINAPSNFQKELDINNLKEDIIYEKLKEKNYEVIKNAFFEAEIELSHARFDINFSGSTSNLVLILGDKILCANAGDSRAIIVSENKRNGLTKIRNSGYLYEFYNYEIESLSVDHKPDLEFEKKRIISSGGRVDRYSENGINSGPFRVWLKNENYPGLAMSRSVGDLIAESVGVICEPEIIEHEITEDSRYIVIASDGVWEFLDNQKVMNLVNPFYANNDPEGACNVLIRESTDWWEKEDCVVDDITAVVIFLNCK